MEQLVIIAIVGLISLVNWLMKRSAEVREERRQERQRQGIPEGDPYHPTASAEQDPVPPSPSAKPSPDMRRLMEALGLPHDDEDLIVQEEVPVVHPRATPPPPPLPVFQPAPKPDLRNERTKNTDVALSRPEAASPLALALHSQSGLRQAIVLREILGPPKAFTL